MATPQNRRTGTSAGRGVASASGTRTATPQSFLAGLFPGAKPTQVAIAPQAPTQSDQPLDEEAVVAPELLELDPEEASQADATNNVWQLAQLAVVGVSSLFWIGGGILTVAAVYVFLRANLRG